MALVVVAIMRTESDPAPREIRLDDAIERDAALIESLKRQQRRGDLYSVAVAPLFHEPPAAPPAKAVKKAAAPAAE